MIRTGRALGAAAAWIVIPVGAATVGLLSEGGRRDGWDGLGYLVLGSLLYSVVLPVALLTGSVVVALRRRKAHSVAGLGFAAGLIGLVAGSAVVALLLATQLQS